MREPTFAVVGRVNEGKSSIVAALTENDAVEIGPEPGTTRVANHYHLDLAGERLFTIIDTPGFQEPEAAFEWLNVRAKQAAERPAAIQAFLTTFAGQERFEDECRLLKPIMEGASVLYVVDSSHPFRPSYEYEMQILRWTGRACFALINQTGDRDYTTEWTAALKQYFNAVRPFNAQKNRFEDRMTLLAMLAELAEEDRPALMRAIELLRRRRRDQYLEASAAIAAGLIDMVSFRITNPSRNEVSAADKGLLEERFQSGIARREREARQAVEAAFSHHRISRVEADLTRPLFDQDIFSEETWQLLGQSRTRLIAAGALSGALVGGTIDAMTLGHSFLLGTLVGGGLGGIGSAYAALKSPEAQLMGLSISGNQTVIGPHQNPNFAWILLDRALLHAHAVANRSHAENKALHLSTGDQAKQGLVNGLSKATMARLEQVFRRLRKAKVRESDRETLRTIVNQILVQE